MAKFFVTYSLHGTATSIVEAENEADLQAKIIDMSDDEFPAPDTLDDIDWDIQEMFEKPDGGWTTRHPST